MAIIIVDDALRSKLLNLTEPLELCDESGRILARVTPQLGAAKYGPLVPQVSDEELERRARSNEKRYTTAEVLAHLEKL
jgi:hypothetical protein